MILSLHESHCLPRNFLETPIAPFSTTIWGFNFKVLIMAKKIILTPNAYYHYRTDNTASSVKNINKVFCVCDEYQEIEKYIKEHNCYEKVKNILPVAKYSNYMWNYKRLPLKGKVIFLKKFSHEFAHHQKEGLINQRILGKRKFKRILLIINKPILFHILYTITHIPHYVGALLKK